MLRIDTIMRVLLALVFQFLGITMLFAQSSKDSLLLVLGTTTDAQERAEAFYLLGWKYYPNSPDSMLHFLDKSIESTDDVQTIANSERALGVATYLLTEYQGAMEHYMEALDGFQAIGDDFGIAKCYNSIGLCLSSMKNYEAALAYHWKSLGILKKILNTYSDPDSLLKARASQGHNYINLIVSYEESPQKDSTLFYTQKSIELFESLSDSFYLAMSYNRQAQALYRLGRYSESIENNRFVFNNFKDLSPYEETFTYLGIAQNSVELGDIETSIDYGIKAYDLAKKNKANWHLQHCARVLSKAYAQQGQFEKAYQYHVEYKSLSDTLFNQNNERRISNLMLKQQELRNDKLIQENKLNEERISRKNQQIYLGIAGLLTLGIFVLLLYKNQRKQKYLNNQLTLVNQELKESNSSKDKFFSIIAHDLKAPFNSILGFLHILKMQLEKLSKEEILSFTDMMLSTTNNTYKLLENLLEWSRLQTGDISYNPSKFLINEAINESVELFVKVAEAKNIALKMEDNKAISVVADRNMVNTVLRNLISNAIKFTKSGGEVTLLCREVNDRVEVLVKDNGIGIPENMLPTLFDASEKFSTQGTEQEKGTGLGLALSKEFMEKHNSTITVRSEERKGSEFSFDLSISDNAVSK